MKTLLLFLFCSISSFLAYSQKPPAPPPPPPQEDIFMIVETMPRFPGCEGDSIPQSKKTDCANKKLLEFIYKNIKYPEEAKRDSIQGTVVVQYVVEQNGSISNAIILKKIGGGCDEEALRVVNMMPVWEPGRQRGRAVRVRYTLPIKFRLE